MIIEIQYVPGGTFFVRLNNEIVPFPIAVDEARGFVDVIVFDAVHKTNFRHRLFGQIEIVRVCKAER